MKQTTDTRDIAKVARETNAAKAPDAQGTHVGGAADVANATGTSDAPDAQGTRPARADLVPADYQTAFAEIDMPADMEERVRSAMRARAQERQRAESAGSAGRGARVSRRGFLAGGVAAVAGACALGLGLPAVLGGRGESGEQTDSKASTGTNTSSSAVTPRAGLSVAMAEQPGTPVELALANEGFMPMRDRLSIVQAFRFNFAVTGDDLERAVFRLEDVPNDTGEMLLRNAEEWEGIYTPRISSRTFNSDGTSETHYFESFEDFAEALLQPQPLVTLATGSYKRVEFTSGDAEAIVDDAAAAGGVAEFRESPAGNGYQVLSVSQVEKIPIYLGGNPVDNNVGWETGFGDYRIVQFEATEREWAQTDPLLTTLWECARDVYALDEETFGQFVQKGEVDDVEAQAVIDAARATIADAVDEAFGDDDAALLAWGREVYTSVMTIAAQKLQMATLVLEAQFTDGTSEERRYRFGRVTDWAERLGERFDALSELPGAFDPEVARDIGIYFGSLDGFIDVSPDYPTEDARLSAPLFTITDVTKWQA